MKPEKIKTVGLREMHPVQGQTSYGTCGHDIASCRRNG